MQHKSIPVTADANQDCYAILGIPATADDAAIRVAFTALVQQYHPDRFSGPRDEAQRRLSDLAAAYEILSDPVRRRRHDLHRRIHAVTATIDVRTPATSTSVASAAANDAPPRRGRRRRRGSLYALTAVVLLLTGFAILYSSRLSEESAPPPADAVTPPTAGQTPPAPEAQAATDAEAPAPVARQAAPPASKPAPTPAPGAVARKLPANRASDAAPAGAASEACSDVLTALGLCKPH